ncbi:MAG TPA: amidase family protein [bacterium]|nr:amidase family protein [bacterium]
MPNADLCDLSAWEMGAAIRAKQVSPVEIVDAILARIDRVNPTLNAYCTIAAGQARAAAREAEAAVMRGDALGILHGIPVSVKDLIETAGIRTTMGSLVFAEYVPEEDAPVVARAKRAGAIILGKTNTPEFGHKAVTDNRVFGPTRNPWSLAHTSGGSSGGAAAAVAAGLGPLAVGTDGGGSVRIPSSCCGVFGLKPTLGRVAQAPVFGGLETASHIGPMARSVRDAAMLFAAIVGPDPRDPGSLPADGTDYMAVLQTGVRGLRVAWTPDWGYAAVDPEVRRIAEAGATRFAEIGCGVDEAGPEFTDPAPAFEVVSSSTAAARWGDALATHRGRFDPSFLPWIEEGMTRTAVEFVRAANHRRTLNDAFRRFFERFDLLLTPTLAAPPLPVGVDAYDEIAGRPVGRLGWLAFTFPLNMVGYPAASVPCGRTTAGLPVGLQIVGPRLADALVLRAAAAFEAVAPWAADRPPVG